MSRLWKGMVLAPWLTLAWASNALAQSNPGEQVGENIKDLALGIAGPIFIAVVVIFVLTLFGARKIGELMVFGAVAFVISLFVFNSTAMTSWMKRVGEYVLGG